jgi:L-threonylcarbamoyladenylate synthase
MNLKIPNDIKQFAACFKKDSLVLFPTDTIVGLGCRYDSVDGIARIRKLKGIVGKNPMAILISNLSQLDMLQVRRSKLSNAIMQKFWPGGLTIVLTSEITLPCCGEGNSIGLRMPDSETLRKIIDTIGVPLAATSANLHGQPAPGRLNDVSGYFSNEVDHVIEFDIKPLSLPSTVISIEAGNLKVIREGAVTREDLYSAIGDKFEPTDI